MVTSPAPPPEDTWRERLRDWRRSLSRLNRVQHWLFTRAAWWVLAFLAFYALGGLLLGWATGYEVLLGITSPAATAYPLYSVLLSLVGWLLVPAVVGGGAGYLVSRQIDRRRRFGQEELLRRMLEQTAGPGTAPAAGSDT